MYKKISKKGDFTFYSDDKNKKYYQIGNEGIKKVTNYTSTSRYASKNSITPFEIRYDTNGEQGFVIFYERKLLKLGIWEYSRAEEIFNNYRKLYNDKKRKDLD